MEQTVIFLAHGRYPTGTAFDGLMDFATIPAWGQTLQGAVNAICKRKKIHFFELAALRREHRYKIGEGLLNGLSLSERIDQNGWGEQDIHVLPGLNFIGTYHAVPMRAFKQSLLPHLKKLGMKPINSKNIPETEPYVRIRGGYPLPLGKGQRIFSPEGVLAHGPVLPAWTQQTFSFPAVAAVL